MTRKTEGEEWREAERRLQVDPRDDDALLRAVTGRRRTGQAVPLELLERLALPARPFRSASPFQVVATLPGGEIRDLGATGPDRPEVLVPAHRSFTVAPREQRLADALAVAAEQEAPGLDLVWRAGMAPDSLTKVAALGHLSSLRLEGWDLPGAALTPLQRLSGLNHLALVQCRNLLNAGLAPLSALERLVSLELDNCRANRNAGLEHVVGLPHLARLVLVASQLTDAGLETVAKAAGLVALGLRFCGAVTPQGLAQLAGLERLRRLDLTGCGPAAGRESGAWYDEALEALAAATPGLAELSLEAVGERGLAALGRLDRLRALELEARPAPARSLALLGGFPLERLRFNHPQNLDDAALDWIAGLSGLVELRLHYSKLKDASFARLAALERLEVLQLSSSQGLSDGALAKLARLPALRRLDLRSCPKITDRGVGELAAATKLEELVLAMNGQLTDAGLARLAEGAPSLRRLDLVLCTGIRQVEPLLRLPALDEVAVHWTGLLDPDLAELQRQRPRLLIERDPTRRGWAQRPLV